MKRPPTKNQKPTMDKTSKTVAEMVDEAANYVGQLRLAIAVKDEAHIEKCLEEAYHLLFEAALKLEGEWEDFQSLQLTEKLVKQP